MSTRRRSTRRSAKSASRAPGRAKVVWLALTAAMTGVGGVLLALDRPAPRSDGMSLVPLAATGASSNIESIFRTRKELDSRRWTSIVIHHSAAASGSPESIEKEHLARQMRGLGHHFIVGNGKGMIDGELAVGYRWLDQLPGAHAGGPEGDAYNQHGISICLVGDGNRQGFTEAQSDRLVSLVRALCAKFNIPPSKVLLHGDIAPISDPGRFFPEAAFREQIRAGR